MERLKTRAYLLGGAFIIFGIALATRPTVAYPVKTEDWMEQKSPEVVDGYRFMPGSQDLGQTNKMNQETYDVLKPFGIVSRAYAKGNRVYDVVLIAGNDSQTFHDPRVCFTAQGYRIDRERQLTIETKTRGPVTATFADLSGRPGINKAVFLYRTPYRFVGKTGPLKIDMFKAQLAGKADRDAVFYRFIPLDPTVTEKELLDFVRDYVDTAKEVSDGYF
jgi:hypothetical protein